MTPYTKQQLPQQLLRSPQRLVQYLPPHQHPDVLQLQPDVDVLSVDDVHSMIITTNMKIMKQIAKGKEMIITMNQDIKQQKRQEEMLEEEEKDQDRIEDQNTMNMKSMKMNDLIEEVRQLYWLTNI